MNYSHYHCWFAALLYFKFNVSLKYRLLPSLALALKLEKNSPNKQSKFLTTKMRTYKGLKCQFRVSLTLTSWRGAENKERSLWLADNSAVADEAIPWPGGPEALVSIRERKNVFEDMLLLKRCLSESHSLGYWLQFYLGILGILLKCKRLSCNPLDFCANLGVIFTYSLALAIRYV